MDFGLVSLDGWVGSDTTKTITTTCPSTTTLVSLNTSADPESTKHKSCYGSEFIIKPERSCTTEDDLLRSSNKVLKTESLLVNQQRNNTSLKANTTLFSDGQQQQQQQQQLLSFSCPTKSQGLSLLDKSSQNPTYLPYTRNTGYNYGSFNGVSMHGSKIEVRWPFTASQWMELEHQALIYKYITANVPIPTNLLIPIKKAFDSASFSAFAGGLLRPNALGWGTFHLGFSSNADPEPGRCRRTDGKKWRCSRDAVANQKYCERHMNRGRHRSRKPVEGRSVHSAATTAKLMSASTSASSVDLGPCGSRETNSLTVANQQQQEVKNLQSVSKSHDVSMSTSINRMFYNNDNFGVKTEDTTAFSMIPSKIKEMPFLESKQQSLSELTQSGLVNSDSLLNLSQKSSSLMSCKTFGSSQDLTDHGTLSQSCLRQFMDDWPKPHSELTDRTQLADFMSSTSSPNNEKSMLSPLRLSCEFDPIQMGLGVGSITNESSQRQAANWIPISWEASIGGPLGEVLNSTNNSVSESKNSSALNLMTEGWESSPRLGSSPTGVLQKTTLASLSCSSGGSSPRVEHSKGNEGAAT